MKNAIRAILRTIPSRLRYRVMLEFARSLRVDEISVAGDNGKISVSLDDWTIAKEYAAVGYWDRHVIRFVRTYFQEHGGGTFIDVGANIGLVAIPCATIQEVVCYAFEPDPANFSLLRRNVIRNGVEAKVHAINAAVFSQNTPLEFEQSKYNHGDHRLRASDGSIGLMQEADRTRFTVDAVRLDDAIPIDDLRKPIVLKVDTQGAEPFVFEGAPRVLASADMAFFEFWPYALTRLGGNVRAMLDTVLANFRTATLFDGDEAIPPFTATKDIIARLERLDSSDPQVAAEIIAVR